MSRSKRGKARQRRQNHHHHYSKESGKASPAPAAQNGPVSQAAGEGAKAIVTPRCSVEQPEVVASAPTPNDSPKPATRASQSWLSRSVSISSAGAPPVSEAEESFESLLDGLTGPDLQTAKLIVQALRAPEDLSRLRRLAVTHGFVNDRIRAVVWPRLLGITPPGHVGLKLGQPPSLPPSSPAASRSRLSAASLSAETPLPPQSQQQQQQPLRHAVAPTSPFSGPDRSRPDGDQTAPPTASQPPRWRRRSSESPQPRPDGAEGASPCGARNQSTGAESLCPGISSGGGGRGSGAGGGDHHRHHLSLPSCAAEDGSGAGDGGGGGAAAAAGGKAAALVPRADGGEARRVARCASCGGALPSCSSSSSDTAASTRSSGISITTSSTTSHTRLGVNGGGAEGPDRDAALGRDRHREQEPGAPSRRVGQEPDRDGAGAGRGSFGSWELELEWQQYLWWSGQSHRDSGVVEVDVARSLWAFTRERGEEEREARRGQLKRLLNATVAAHQGDVFYYQGLHDVASVLLLAMPGTPPPPLPLPPPAPPPRDPAPLSRPPAATPPPPPACPHCGAPASATAAASTAASPTAAVSATPAATPATSVPPSSPPSPPPPPPASAAAAAAAAISPVCPAAAAAAAHPAAAASAMRGELLAFALLRRLTTTHLRDATRPSLEPVVQLLGLMPALVSAADPQLGRHLAALDLQPYFALSWLITWWAHELDELAPATRLYDFFLAGHPLLPLYVGAVAMRAQRTALLSCREMPELHSALTNLKLGAAAAPGGGGGGRWSGRSSGGGSGGGGGGFRRSGSSVGGGGGQDGGGGMMPLEELLRQAERLWRAKPPQALVPPPRPPRGSRPSEAAHGLRQRRGGGGGGAGRHGGGGGVREDEDGCEGAACVRLTACVAHAARMEGRPAFWTVPDAAPAEWPLGWVPGAEVEEAGAGSGGLGRVLSQANSALGGGRSRTALLGTALLAGMYVAAAVAIGYATFSRAMAGQQ
ncbi:hypothetical protein PLESTB_000458300 [Pleodorina starrii]|uniref:Rab-GAP TBC domain-containing protein n=1 Tax=Pleodorina starrii TaxID=330485 RepID=A0A9W6EZV5_9CHLO|nr:hypothetical protein PLESTM_000759900 [Pleodorina starrii]GLC51029.1 hypothetical protein PLESTB_000458300 [Pleodorina starrii]